MTYHPSPGEFDTDTPGRGQGDARVHVAGEYEPCQGIAGKECSTDLICVRGCWTLITSECC